MFRCPILEMKKVPLNKGEVECVKCISSRYCFEEIEDDEPVPIFYKKVQAQIKELQDLAAYMNHEYREEK